MKYKLAKEYPGSLKLGTVVEAPEDCQTLFIIEDGVCFTYDQGLLDRYPEYWEKVLPEEGLLVSEGGSLVYKLSDGSGYGFVDGNYTIGDSWTFSYVGLWKPATPEQEEKFVEMLWGEWVKMGNDENTKLECHAKDFPSKEKDLLNQGKYFLVKTCQELWNKNGVIFHKGEFATPLKETTTMPQVGKQYTHKKGNTYTVIGFTNNLGDREDKDFPVTVVYMDQEGRHWSRPLSKWHGSFELKEQVFIN